MDQSEGDVLEAPAELASPASPASPSSASASSERRPPTAEKIVPELERQRGNIAATARSFAMDRMTFARLMARLGIKRPRPAPGDEPGDA